MPQLKYYDGTQWWGVEPRKNYIIDGGFQVAQANPVVGTVVTNPTSTSYPVCDMWKYWINADGGTLPTTINNSQQIENGETFYRISPNGAGTSFGANSYCQIEQFIENGVKKLCGLNKTITVSFEARSSIPNKHIGVYCGQSYGTGGTPSSDELLLGNTFTLTSSWVKYTVTFTTNTLTGKTFGTNNDDTLGIFIALAMGSGLSTPRNGTTIANLEGAGDIDIRRVKLETGNVSTTFEQEPFGDVLQKCMRYYEKSYAYQYAPGTNISTSIVANMVPSNSIVAGQVFNSVQYKVQKRIVPTIKFYSQAGTTGTASNQTGTDLTANTLNPNDSGANAFEAYTNAALTTTGNLIKFHFVSDARF